MLFYHIFFVLSIPANKKPHSAGLSYTGFRLWSGDVAGKYYNPGTRGWHKPSQIVTRLHFPTFRKGGKCDGLQENPDFIYTKKGGYAII
jgi:hypothetical protein